MLKELEGYDWEYAFEYAGEQVSGYGGYGSPDIRHAVPTDTETSLKPFTREDVVKVTAISEGENDGPEWLVVGQLRDRRWFILAAGCDYTGWDCQAGGSASVARTKADLLKYGVTAREKERLGLR